MEKFNPAIGLAGRSLMAALFILSGLGKISGYAGVQGTMESAGLPGVLLPAVIALELSGGLAVIIGWQTRVAALFLAVFCLVTAVIFHNQLGDQLQQIMFLKNLAMAGGFLLLVKHGAGELSLDNRRRGATGNA